MQSVRSGFEHGANSIPAAEYSTEYGKLAVVGEKFQAGVDVINVEREGAARQQVTDRTVVIRWITGWIVRHRASLP
jgi:hypothetical protein